MAARRFLWRWNMRVVRRDARQFCVIFALVWLGVLLSTSGVLAAYNLVEPPESEFGKGRFSATTDDVEQLERLLTDQGHPFAIVQSATAGVAGTTQRFDIKVLDPDNEVAGPLIALVDGRWPAAGDEVALTDRALASRPDAAATVDVGGRDYRVVGTVENPTDLAEEFVLGHDDRVFASMGGETATLFLIDADESEVNFTTLGSYGTSTTGPAIRTVAAIIVSVISVLGMLEVALLVGSSFAVIAARRSREFGLLAAAGATPKQIRAAARTVGTILGVAAATTGVLVGVLVTASLVPRMETAVGHRIAFAVPWWAIAFNAFVAVVVASAAARWPARSMSRRPVAYLLASLRPRREPVGRTAVAGVVLTILGGSALGVGFANLNTLLAVAGTLVAPVGLLLMSPLLVHMVGRLSARLPLASRMAGRAIARHTRRSASAVAALALAMALPVAVVVVTASLDARDVDEGPNLADNWMIGWVPGANDASPRIPAAVDDTDVEATMVKVAAVAPSLQLIPLQMAVPTFFGFDESDFDGTWDFDSIGPAKAADPLVSARVGATDCAFCDIESYGFGDGIDYIVDDSWIASAELLGALGIDSSWLDTSAAAVAETDGYGVASVEGIVAEKNRVAVSDSWPRNTRVPSVLLARDLVDNSQYDIVTIGWLAVDSDPISAATIADVIDAAGGDLLIESHVPPEPKSALRLIALIAGLLIGVGIALSAVTLISAELEGDRWILTSIGATPRAVQRLAATVGAMLAGCGAVIAVMIGYLPLLPMLTAKEAEFPFVVPWSAIAAFLVLLPAVVAIASWAISRGPARARSLRESM